MEFNTSRWRGQGVRTQGEESMLHFPKSQIPWPCPNHPSLGLWCPIPWDASLVGLMLVTHQWSFRCFYNFPKNDSIYWGQREGKQSASVVVAVGNRNGISICRISHGSPSWSRHPQQFQWRMGLHKWPFVSPGGMDTAGFPLQRVAQAGSSSQYRLLARKPQAWG